MATSTITLQGNTFQTTPTTVLVSDKNLSFALPAGWTFGSSQTTPPPGFVLPSGGGAVAFVANGSSRSPSAIFSGWNNGSLVVTHQSTQQTYSFSIYVTNGGRTAAWNSVSLAANGALVDENEIVINNT